MTDPEIQSLVGAVARAAEDVQISAFQVNLVNAANVPYQRPSTSDVAKLQLRAVTLSAKVKLLKRALRSA